jgi:hypothetical protein
VLQDTFPHKAALNVRPTFLALAEVINAVPWNESYVASVVAIRVATLKAVAAAPLDGCVVKWAWGRNLQGILDIGKTCRQCQPVVVDMWEHIQSFRGGHGHHGVHEQRGKCGRS